MSDVFYDRAQTSIKALKTNKEIYNANIQVPTLAAVERFDSSTIVNANSNTLTSSRFKRYF